MTYLEAQEQSPCKIAIYGNIAMKDVVWPKGEPGPYWWISKYYKPMKLNSSKLECYKNSNLWEPADYPTDGGFFHDRKKESYPEGWVPVEKDVEPKEVFAQIPKVKVLSPIEHMVNMVRKIFKG